MTRDYAVDTMLYNGVLLAFADVSDLEELKKYDEWAKEAIDRIQENLKEIEKYRKALFKHTQDIAFAPMNLTLSIIRQTVYNYGHPNVISYSVQLYNTIDGIREEQYLINERYSGADWRKAVQRFNDLKKQYPQAELKDFSKKRK